MKKIEHNTQVALFIKSEWLGHYSTSEVSKQKSTNHFFYSPVLRIDGVENIGLHNGPPTSPLKITISAPQHYNARV